MTNAERFIGDEDLIDTFIEEFVDYAETKDIDFKYHYLKETLTRFFKASVKPTLTEDERVILRNVGKDYQRIERDDECLWVRGVDADGFMATCYFKCYDHLFQFIKERRRILY